MTCSARGAQVKRTGEGKTTDHKILVMYEAGSTCAEERIRRDLRAWVGSATVERLDEDHAVMVIRPGGALNLPRKEAQPRKGNQA